MKRAITCGCCLGLMFIIAACSPRPSNQIQQQIDRAPDWYTNPPEDTNDYLYTVSSAISARREVSRQIAETNARTSMAQKLETKVEALEKIFTEEVTGGTDSNYSQAFTLASQSITSTTLRGVTADQIEFVPTDDGQFECFIITRMPVGEARSALDNALSQDEELYIRFKESQAFQELQENLERLSAEE